MDLLDAIIDRIFPSADYKTVLERPWLKRNWRKERQFLIPVDYLVAHLDKREFNKVLGKKDPWQEKKKETIRRELDSGKESTEMLPIFITLHQKKHLFRIRDGVSKISVFFERNIPAIIAVVVVGDW